MAGERARDGRARDARASAGGDDRASETPKPVRHQSQTRRIARIGAIRLIVVVQSMCLGTSAVLAAWTDSRAAVSRLFFLGALPEA